MESVWYYARDGAQTGPVSFDDLKAAVGAGQIRPDDLVWREGTPDWVPAKAVPGLIAAPAAPSSPPPSPSRPAAPAVPPRPKKPEAPLPIHDAPLPVDQRGPSAQDVVGMAQEFLRRTAAQNPATIIPTPEEEQALTQAGYDTPAKKFAVWRRAVLWVAVVPSAFAALFGLINVLNMERSQKDQLNGFGHLVFYLQAFALFALPVTAALAALAYDKLAKSARLVLIGAAVTLCVPILVAFVPTEWIIDPKASPIDLPEAASLVRALVGQSWGLNFYLLLLPLLLSLLPAVTWACLRMKMFLPESLVPGWGLVVGVPVFAFFTLSTFVMAYHAVGNPILAIALVLWFGAPFIYLSKFRILTRPSTEAQDIAALTKTQLYVLGAVGLGLMFLLIYLVSGKVLGFDSAKSIMRPWSLRLHAFWLEFVARALVLTILFADLLVRMALLVWREERAFVGTPQAETFERTMSGLGPALETKGTPPVA